MTTAANDARWLDAAARLSTRARPASYPNPGVGCILLQGDRVVGRYLGQPFTGVVHDVQPAAQPGDMRVTLHFDDPVDVVTFPAFSNWRQRVSALIDDHGRSPHRTSDGVPQMIVGHLAV